MESVNLIEDDSLVLLSGKEYKQLLEAANPPKEKAIYRGGPDLAKMVLSCTKDISVVSKNGFVKITDIEESLELSRGINKSDVKKTIDQLRRDGTLFSPRTGYVAVS